MAIEAFRKRGMTSERRGGFMDPMNAPRAARKFPALSRVRVLDFGGVPCDSGRANGRAQTSWFAMAAFLAGKRVAPDMPSAHPPMRGARVFQESTRKVSQDKRVP